ncbi:MULTISPECIES: AmmeMemoRadiSam system protein B [unclassified Desulfovibrio]|uniref:AmmeMemoRadiSam system protein B n=1 Tax=unclassified Desulfovibrio TaxID=2593640 RepID=UPI000F5F8A64|nr:MULTISPECIES: AmmeMemoRadiSam system protein B [unclassified Desulfovibrio]RRD69497.1 AmmeMemoRadiSam system protein B [Desulfovibrio sp. OH1209_COT-279]RRD86176.1 AmmeMemoRadiSam system protein B [Desulfovibrio sp. OH1186_COT-070]
MSIRTPVVAGRFYAAASDRLEQDVLSLLQTDCPHTSPQLGQLLGLMLPHAGYIYSGKVAGATLACPWGESTAGACLPERIVVLCPNHTGQGHPLGVWPEGEWLTPLGSVSVDRKMAAALCDGGEFAPDTRAHATEHSIEVLLPFLQCLPPPPGRSSRSITPVCVGMHDPQALRRAGHVLAEAVRASEVQGQQVALLISSDMNHYEDQEKTLVRDARVLQQALTCDPEALLTTVAAEQSSMCGAHPLALALYAAQALGSPQAELIAYDTSATASGDTHRVVGYAGLVLGLA